MSLELFRKICPALRDEYNKPKRTPSMNQHFDRLFFNGQDGTIELNLLMYSLCTYKDSNYTTFNNKYGKDGDKLLKEMKKILKVK